MLLLLLFWGGGTVFTGLDIRDVGLHFAEDFERGKGVGSGVCMRFAENGWGAEGGLEFVDDIWGRTVHRGHSGGVQFSCGGLWDVQLGCHSTVCGFWGSIF